MPKTVYLGMSGGVDSSVSALLLKQQGYHVVGVYMKNWSKDLPGMKCPWAEDLADAKRVAVKLDLDFEVWDFEEAYKKKVVDYMLAEFKKGNTPNPDIMCNQEIKFRLFYDEAMKRGADFIATGHYANVRKMKSSFEGVRLGLAPRSAPEKESFHFSLCKAADENKDQTYFLYRMPQDALVHTLFPIGEMLKPDVKKLAEQNGLHNAYKKESMGVCFVGEVGMKDFLKEYIDVQPGEIRELETEQVLGYHEGAIFYTIGQRHGLYIGGGLPYYVVKKDLDHNIIYVSKNLNAADLWTSELELKDVFVREGEILFSSSVTRRESLRDSRVALRLYSSEKSISPSLQVRLRHRAPLIPAKFDGTKVIFGKPIKRVAPGQSVVFYDGEICLGGGIVAA